MARRRSTSSVDIPESSLDQIFVKWLFRPDCFFREGLGAKLSNQQEDGLKQLGRLFQAKHRASLGHSLSAVDLALSKKTGISIASGHGTGKDFTLAGVNLWLLTCWKPATALVTGPNFSTIKSVLWKELRRFVREGRFFGEDPGWLSRFFEVMSTRVESRSLAGEQFLEARSCQMTGGDDEQGEALAGRHNEYMILEVDEASAPPDGVFKPLEGAKTGRINIGFLIGNMTKHSGYFYRTHYDPMLSPFWLCLRWDAEESNLDEVTNGATQLKSAIEFYEKAYGRESNPFRVRIQGLPPTSQADVLIPWDWVQAAVGREIVQDGKPPLVYGVDVARGGDDKSVLLKRRGNVVESLREYSRIDTMQLVGWIVREYADDKELGDVPVAIFIDVIGLGAGVYDRLREMKYCAYAVNVANTAVKKDKFGRLRNELWWAVREKFEAGTISIPDDKELTDELSTMKVHPPDSKGVMQVYSKAELKKQGYKSPNKADALCLTYALGDRLSAGVPRDPNPKTEMTFNVYDYERGRSPQSTIFDFNPFEEGGRR